MSTIVLRGLGTLGSRSLIPTASAPTDVRSANMSLKLHRTALARASTTLRQAGPSGGTVEDAPAALPKGTGVPGALERHAPPREQASSKPATPGSEEDRELARTIDQTRDLSSVADASNGGVATNEVTYMASEIRAPGSLPWSKIAIGTGILVAGILVIRAVK